MEVPAHLRIRMAKRNLSHAYLVVGRNRSPGRGPGRRLGLYRGDLPAGTARLPEGRPGNSSRYYPGRPRGEGLKAEEVRALRSDAYIRPNEAPKKVYLLEHSELLNPTGQNILLKLIEEGPAYACFLFLSPQPGLLLPTIRSRCETLRAPGRDPAGRPGGGDLSRPDPHRGLSPDRLPFLPLPGEEGPEEFPSSWRPPCPGWRRNCPAARPAAGAGPPGPIRAACEFPVSPPAI